MRTSKNLSLVQQASYSNSQPQSLIFWQKFKGRQVSGKVLQWKKEGLQVCPERGCWPGEGGPIRSEASSVIS